MTIDGFPEFDPCDMCNHPEHNDDETCEQIIGYGHLTGDQFCGCPGSLQQQLDAQRMIGIEMTIEAIRKANAGYRLISAIAAETLIAELETSLLSPLPNTGTIPETDTIHDPD